jgi:hypothetical protein
MWGRITVSTAAKKKVIATHEFVKGGRKTKFFADQLPGEEALTHATAEKLFYLAEEIYCVKPWERMGDADLVIVKDPVSRQMCYCCVMGALGEHYAIQGYLGTESYEFFKRIQSDEAISVGDFYGSQSGVSVEFLPSSQLTPADKELARAFGHPLSRGLAAPQFRTNRQGYYPWYVTEPEAKVLALCLDSVLAFCEERGSTPSKQYWAHADVYPEVVWSKRDYFRVRDTLLNTEPTPPPELAAVDEERLATLLMRDYAIRGAIELDHFFTGIPVGQKRERKACLRAVLAIDAETGFLYAMEIVETSAIAGEFLPRILMSTIQSADFIPAEVCVHSESARLLLSPLAERLGFSVKAKNRLPVLESAKLELLQRLGDPGMIRS